MKPIVIALGGNAIIKKGDSGDLKTIEKRIQTALKALYPMIVKHPTVITHGNGPSVGRLLLLQKASTVKMPLDVLDAQTEGQTGYLIQQHLGNMLRAKKQDRTVATILTQSLVDIDDPAFKKPTKFVGHYYTTAQALKYRKQFTIRKDANKGWRRVVASPQPERIIETPVIKQLLKNNTIVIAAGGGGIPVVQTRKGLDGVEAVVDKDRASACLAHDLGAQTLIIITSEQGAYTRYGTKEQRLLKRMHVADARAYLHAGHFQAGSMGPKIQAAIDFLALKSKHPKKAIITDTSHIVQAMRGKAGTTITR